MESAYESPYIEPIRKTLDTPTFFFIESCSCHTRYIGMTKRNMSEIMLIAAEAISIAPRFMQLPSSIGLQILLLGMQDQMVAMLTAR